MEVWLNWWSWALVLDMSPGEPFEIHSEQVGSFHLDHSHSTQASRPVLNAAVGPLRVLQQFSVSFAGVPSASVGSSGMLSAVWCIGYIPWVDLNI